MEQWTPPSSAEFHSVCLHVCRCVGEGGEHRNSCLVNQAVSLVMQLQFPSLLHFPCSFFCPPHCFFFTGAKTLKCLSKTDSISSVIHSFAWVSATGTQFKSCISGWQTVWPKFHFEILFYFWRHYQFYVKHCVVWEKYREVTSHLLCDVTLACWRQPTFMLWPPYTFNIFREHTYPHPP